MEGEVQHRRTGRGLECFHVVVSRTSSTTAFPVKELQDRVELEENGTCANLRCGRAPGGLDRQRNEARHHEACKSVATLHSHESKEIHNITFTAVQQEILADSRATVIRPAGLIINTCYGIQSRAWK